MIRDTLELLLAGEFICSVTHPDAAEDLQHPAIKKQISDVLDTMDRKLVSTPNSSAWYAAWKHIGPQERDSIKKEFTIIKQQMRPVVEFIHAIMDADLRDSPLMPGIILKESELLARIQASPYLEDQIHKILFHISKRKSQDPLPVQFSAVLDSMVKNGLLQEVHKGERIFTITGRIDYVYAVLEFIDAHEHITDTSTTDTNIGKQEDLL